MARAFVFPGQGSQTVGMGRALAEAYPEARAVFDEVDEALGEKPLSATIWEGPEDALRLTENAQPALMATSIAALRALEAEGVTVAGSAAFVAGHSLGEYTALCARGLDRRRGCGAAAAAARAGDAVGGAGGRGRDGGAAGPRRRGGAGGGRGGVGAGASARRPTTTRRARSWSPAQGGGGEGGGARRGRGAKRAVLLPVSAPFHCAMMAPAAEVMAKALAETEIAAPVVPLVANVKAEAVSDPDEIRRAAGEAGHRRGALARGRAVDGGAGRDRAGRDRRRQGADRACAADRQGALGPRGRDARGRGGGGRRAEGVRACST
jgi:[acyl-carrier-protein] S-malonyltransferase